MRILVMEFTYSGSRRGVHLIRSLLHYGHEVYHLTNVPVTQKPLRLGLRVRRTDDEVLVIEVPNPRAYLPWRGLFMRMIIQTINMLLFTIAVIRKFRVLRDVDVIIARGMHPFTEPPALLLKKMTGAKLVLDVCDPLIEAFEVVYKDRPFFRFFRLMGILARRLIFSIADAIITHTNLMRRVIIGYARYVQKEVHPIYNPIDVNMFRPIDKTNVIKELVNLLPVEEIAGKFMVLYSGTMGPCQDLSRVIDAAKLLPERVVFVLMGAGEEKEMLIERVRKEGLKNVLFWPYVPWHLMPYVINLADACLLPLAADPIYEVALPKKFFEYVACGKPVIAFCPKGEVSHLVEEWRAGVAVDPDDIEGLAEAVRWLSENRELVAEMGRNARRMAETLFSPERIGRQLDRLLREVVSSRDRRAS